ncbi:signal peptidase I [Cellulomonas pakistanensis]|uniref:Signal peptidase I n=1 Tax=Cellulomonas pakistanensis TaxID=992287 RepID=A0A919PE50_9CELL|nr:signal peptidase I [Cellulomonas pakistanensis]GIG38118.1 signal peptidase I [Cellulomonas pakistanensis]
MTDQDAAPASHETPARRSPEGRRGPVASFLRETVIILLSAIVLSWLVKTFLAQAFFIPSASMHDTLLEGDRVLVSKLAPGPLDIHRGDVVVFADPGGWLDQQAVPETNAFQDALIAIGLMPQQSEDHLIKRVIGVAGDRVASTGDGSPLTVNGVPVDESEYLAPGASPSEIAFDVVVPSGSVWVMGDNRQSSADSRFHLGEPGGGSVPVDDVVGTAFVKLWPVDRIGLLRNPGDVFADVPEPA